METRFAARPMRACFIASANYIPNHHSGSEAKWFRSGAAQVARVAHQAVAVEVFAEDALAERNRAFRIDVLESGRAPGFLTGFDDESAGVLIEAIGVELEPAARSRRPSARLLPHH